MADFDVIEGSMREQTSKGGIRSLREGGMVPAVVYGDGKEPALISIDHRIVTKELHRGGFQGRVYELQIGKKKQRILPKDVQLHPVTDVPLHIDFLRLSADARVSVNVPVQFVDEDGSPGLKRGGVLNVVRYEVELSCPADAIPENIELVLTGLEIGDALKISDVKLPDGVEPAITDRDFTIATIAAATVAEEETDGEEGEGEEGADGDAEGGDAEGGEEGGNE
jgi:large subunit ribosomal protein L25